MKINTSIAKKRQGKNQKENFQAYLIDDQKWWKLLGWSTLKMKVTSVSFLWRKSRTRGLKTFDSTTPRDLGFLLRHERLHSNQFKALIEDCKFISQTIKGTPSHTLIEANASAYFIANEDQKQKPCASPTSLREMKLEFESVERKIGFSENERKEEENESFEKGNKGFLLIVITWHPYGKMCHIFINIFQCAFF